MEKCLGCKEDTSSGIRSCVNDNIIPLCKKCHKNTFDRFGSENIGGIFDTIAKWIEPFGSISIDPSSMEQNEALLVLSLLNAGENLIEEGKEFDSQQFMFLSKQIYKDLKKQDLIHIITIPEIKHTFRIGTAVSKYVQGRIRVNFVTLLQTVSLISSYRNKQEMYKSLYLSALRMLSSPEIKDIKSFRRMAVSIKTDWNYDFHPSEIELRLMINIRVDSLIRLYEKKYENWYSQESVKLGDVFNPWTDEMFVNMYKFLVEMISMLLKAIPKKKERAEIVSRAIIRMFQHPKFLFDVKVTSQQLNSAALAFFFRRFYEQKFGKDFTRYILPQPIPIPDSFDPNILFSELEPKVKRMNAVMLVTIIELLVLSDVGVPTIELLLENVILLYARKLNNNNILDDIKGQYEELNQIIESVLQRKYVSKMYTQKLNSIAFTEVNELHFRAGVLVFAPLSLFDWKLSEYYKNLYLSSDLKFYTKNGKRVHPMEYFKFPILQGSLTVWSNKWDKLFEYLSLKEKPRITRIVEIIAFISQYLEYQKVFKKYPLSIQ